MTKKKSYVPINKIKKHLRRLSIQRKEYAAAKNRAKIDKATFKCEHCGKIMYDGSSQRSFDKLKETYPDIVWEKLEMNHINPVIEPKRGFASWDEYLDRLFCAPEMLEALCHDCHQKVSKKEMEQRKDSGSLKRNE